MKKNIIAVLAAIFTLTATAQNATNSPYSQYGFGVLADQANGVSKSMAGMGIAWREHNQANFKNPASYSGIDSLTFIFDAGITGEVTNFNENGHRVNASNSSFDYVVGAFRLFRHVGCAFGVLPYSNVGYSYFDKKEMNAGQEQTSTTTWTNTYSGNGGFRQVFLGLGVEPIKNLSIGANVSYMWGDYSKSIVNSYSDAYVNTLSKYYTSTITGYKLDLGAQYTLALGKNDKVAIGATYSNGHSVGSDPVCDIISKNTQTGVSQTESYDADGKLALPTSFGGGVVYNHANKIRVGLDYTMTKWGEVKFPVYSVTNNVPAYKLMDNQFKNNTAIAFGGEYCANEKSRSYMKRVRLRAGISYSTPYLIINEKDGPKEIGASVGVGLPITNNYNNRSVLNISAQWRNLSAPGMIKENTFSINVGLTFNERWFAKWQVE